MCLVKRYSVLLGCLLSLNSFASSYSQPPAPYKGLYKEAPMKDEVPGNPWSVIASLGYTQYENDFRNDGQTALGRFAIARELVSFNRFTLGLEGGVQSGNRMRLDIPQSTLDILGNLPVQATIKPMLDLLGTLTFSPDFFSVPVFAQVKGGVAYRHLQIDRVTVNNVTKAAGEVQAGLGYQISPSFALTLSYQGVFGGNPDFRVNVIEETARIHNIPVQNSALLGISITL